MTFNDDHALETYKSLISIATEAQRALQYLNGGAVVVLLAYLGQAHLVGCQIRFAYFAVSFFIAGLVLGTLSFLTSYLTQLALYNESVRDKEYKGLSHSVWLWVTAVIVVLSLISFSVGAFHGVAAVLG